MICIIRDQDPLKQGLKQRLNFSNARNTSYSRARSTKTRIETHTERPYPHHCSIFENRIHENKDHATKNSKSGSLIQKRLTEKE